MTDATNRAIAVVTAWRAGEQDLAAQLLATDPEPSRLLHAMTGLVLGAYNAMEMYDVPFTVDEHLAGIALITARRLNGVPPVQGP